EGAPKKRRPKHRRPNTSNEPRRDSRSETRREAPAEGNLLSKLGQGIGRLFKRYLLCGNSTIKVAPSPGRPLAYIAPCMRNMAVRAKVKPTPSPELLEGFNW